MLYLGVDGGGTKTAFALIDQDKNILAEHQEKTCYHIEIGLEGAKDVLNQGIKETFARANAKAQDLDFAFFGLPAYGEDSQLQPIMDELPASILHHNRYRCDNDMVSGWAAGFGCDDGINIVAGTGSIAYGVHNNKSARCGGWGELFGDEGSAYWMGCKALSAFSKMSDGRSPKGRLYQILKTHLNIERDIDISALVHNTWDGSRGKIAQLSTLVCEAAILSDAIALSIFKQAAEELADIVHATRAQLGYAENETTSVSYTGGAFSSKEILLTPFKAALSARSSTYSLEKPMYSPVVGAALYAEKLSNHQ